MEAFFGTHFNMKSEKIVSAEFKFSGHYQVIIGGRMFTCVFVLKSSGKIYLVICFVSLETGLIS